MMKPYPDYIQSKLPWVSKLPRHWRLSKLKFVLEEIIGGGTPDTSNPDYWGDENGIPWVAISDISRQSYITNTVKKITESGRVSKGLQIIPKGTLLVSIFASLGKSTLLGIDATVNQAILGLVPSKSLVRDYLAYFLSDSERYIGYYSSSNTQDNLNLTKIKNLTLVLPSLPEQQAIANFLDRKTAHIDRLIEKKQRQIELLQEQRTALINQAVTKGLNPYVPMKDSGIEWLGKIPSHWQMTAVRYFFDVKLGKMLDSSKQDEYILVKPYLRAANIHWNIILLDEIGVNEMGFTENQLERYLLQPGDLLVTEGGVTVGRSAIWNGELEECYYQNSLNRARPLKKISTKWLYYWMYFLTNNGYIDILADKATFGHLTNEKLKALPIPIPPVSEHAEIIAKIESFEPKVELQNSRIIRQIELLQEYRTALISLTVTGKIDVRGEKV